MNNILDLKSLKLCKILKSFMLLIFDNISS